MANTGKNEHEAIRIGGECDYKVPCSEKTPTGRAINPSFANLQKLITDGFQVVNHMPGDACTMRIGTLTLPMKIDSIYHGENQWVCKVTCDTIPEQEYSGQKFIIKPQPYPNSIEVDIYKRLSELQGRLVPKYHGFGNFQQGGKTFRAFMLGHAAGVPLTDFTRGECSDDSEMKRIIFQAYEELSRHFVVHGDVEERHIFVDELRTTVMLIDFDFGEIRDNENSAAEQNRVDLEELLAKREKRLAYSPDI